MRSPARLAGRYNSLENPIGIETSDGKGAGEARTPRYNSLENPIGIETRLVLLRERRVVVVTTH